MAQLCPLAPARTRRQAARPSRTHHNASDAVTLNAGFTGSDRFTYDLSDGGLTSAPDTKTLDATNAVPTANPQSWDTPQDTALTVSPSDGVLASSSDDDGDTLTAQVVSGPSSGTLTLGSDGSFTYTPNAGFFGTNSFSYDVSDGVSTSDPATVTITVNQVVSEDTPGSVYSAVAAADGDTEVLVADQGLNTVSVFLVDSSGKLAKTPISTIAVGLTPVALAVGDFNGDGLSDVAVANRGDGTTAGTVSILLGAGGGTFTTGTPLTGFNTPVALAVGDFNGDGLTDLAVVNQGNNTVSILLGNGNGTFTPGTLLDTGVSPTSIAAANVNNDVDANNVPILDLVVTNSADNTVSVFLGNGGGTFAPLLPVAVGTAPMSVTTGDFDGDGNVDLAVANSGSNDVSVLLGNGNGTFQAATNYAVGSDPVSVVAGNFNGDGYLDLSVANKGSNTLSNLINLGDGTFLAEQTYPAVSDPVSIATGDFDHDGLTDQAIALADPELVIEKGTLKADAQIRPTGPEAIASDGTLAAVWQSLDKKTYNIVRLWSISTQKPLGNILIANTIITGIAFSPNAQLLAIAGGSSVVIWDLTKNQPASYKPTFSVAQSPTSVAFSPDGSMLAAGTSQGNAMLWRLDPKKGEASPVRLMTISHSAKSVTQVSFWEGELLAVSGDDMDVYDVSKATPRLIENKELSGSVLMTSASVSMKGTNFVIAYSSGNMSLYRWNDGKFSFLEAYSQSNYPVKSVIFTDDYHLLKIDYEGITFAHAGKDPNIFSGKRYGIFDDFTKPTGPLNLSQSAFGRDLVHAQDNPNGYLSFSVVDLTQGKLVAGVAVRVIDPRTGKSLIDGEFK